MATSTAGTHSTNTNPLYIGNNQVFGPRYFQGMLDEISVFNRALTATEISNLYAQASVPEPAATSLLVSMAVLGWVSWKRRRRQHVAA